MKDYKEPISKVQKRHQFKRLLFIIGGMIFAFAIFVGGVRVGIQVERERERIAQQAPSRPTSSKNTKATEGSEKKETTTAPEKTEEKMRFTFYETLTKKEGVEKEAQKKSKTTTEKKAKAKAQLPSPSTTKAEEDTKTPGEKKLYFVQIASFREKAKAEALKDRLAKKGYKIQIIPVQIEGMGLWYRVRLGGYTSLQEAQEFQKRVSFEENIEGAKVVSVP
jgi:cell division protein FtsN